MRIAELIAYIVDLPLRREIKHASATRRESSNLLIRCKLTDGTEGWGEGVPRDYVTGETPAGAIAQLASTPLTELFDLDCQNWRDVIQLCGRFKPAVEQEDPRDCRSNALRCAVELSILDAFGKLFEEPVSRVTSEFAAAREINASRTVVQYSTTITAENAKKERISALKMRIYGFKQCKVKVGVVGANDDERLNRIRWWLGRRFDIRLDANEAWHVDEVVGKIEPLLKHDVTCVEQPVPHEEVEMQAELRRQLPVDLMLDESLTSLVDAEKAIEQETCDLFNIRLSKCGGFLNSLRIADLAQRHGIGYQLGCHPGESGILSSAGRHWAVSVDNIRYLEGSYDRHILRSLLTNEDITFGYGGRAPAITVPGLGVTINPKMLDKLKTCEKLFRM